VCCLSSVNAEKFFEWREDPRFIEDVMRFLDNVLQDFIDRAPKEMSAAVYSAMRERSVGLGLMGFHSFLQSQGLPFEGAMSAVWNKKLFSHLRQKANEASRKLAEERGPCPDAAERGVFERFSHKLAIAPTASISIICGGTSPGIDPIPANIYVHKTLSGSFTVKNPYLERVIADAAAGMELVTGAKDGDAERWAEAQWDSILEHGGSVQHLDWMSDQDKETFRTSFEIDQRWVIEHARDRAEFICQAQSVNLFLPGDVHKWDLHMLHYSAWKMGVKSLYYLRSRSVQRAAHAGADDDLEAEIEAPLVVYQPTLYEECLSCQ
jgi:ribonucleoside-diphosphate reductase alpha chain